MMNEEKARLLRVNEWPRYPILPMVKRTGEFTAPDNAGFLFGDVHMVPIPLYFGNIFMLSVVAEEVAKETGIPLDKVPWRLILDKHQKREFADVDALLAEYRVD